MTYTDDLLQRLRNSPPREICEHGSQRVKCPHCEINVLDAKIIALTDEIERLRAEVATIRNLQTVAESELAALKLRLIEDCDAARDFPANTCGASRHAQMIAESLISGVPYAMLTDDPAYCGQSILSTVKSLFTARTELAALRGRIAAAPVVCIDNGACVTDGARLTIAGGDTYFAHAELCGKRVHLVVVPQRGMADNAVIVPPSAAPTRAATHSPAFLA